MASLRMWISGARLRTLPAAIAPVLIGAGAAAQMHAFNPTKTALAGAVALLLQVGVNYANDYSDGIRGTDRYRTGPPRLTGSRVASPQKVAAAALAALGLAAISGVVLVVISGTWWMLGAGAGAILAAWFYTGGPRPYGYAGLGEVFVFIFFGLLATLGTLWVQAYVVPGWAIAAAAGVGLAACALLMVNNLRDIPTDILAGKHTLATRLGDRGARVVFVGLLVGACLLAVPAALLAHPIAGGAGLFGLFAGALWVGLPVGRGTWRLVAEERRQGKELVISLQQTGIFTLIYGAVLGALLAFYPA